MAELKPYDVKDENGNATTLLLSREDAIARGLIKGKVAASGEVMPTDPGQLAEYEVPTSYGSTTLLLSPEDAKARGLVAEVDPPADPVVDPDAKAVRAPNKSRTAATK